MTSFDRFAWSCTWIAPFGWITALLAFILSLIPGIPGLPSAVENALPLVALIGALAGVLGHAVLGYHVLSSGAFSSEQRESLWRDYLFGVGYQRWRQTMRNRQT